MNQYSTRIPSTRWMFFHIKCLERMFFHYMLHKLKNKIVRTPNINECENYNISKYLEIAERLNIKTTPFGFGFYELRKGNNNRKFMNNLTDKENAMAYKLCGNKYLTHRILLNNGINNIPNHQLYTFNDINKTCADFVRWNYPVVIKPCSGTSYGDGVTVNIKTVKDLKNAIAESFIFDRKAYLMEQYIEGTHFRVVTLKGDFIACSQRIPARIVGNGKDSVRKLIEKENYKRSVDKSEKALYPIIVDNEVKRKLKSINKKLSSVLEKNEEIYVKDVVNIHAGGEVRKIENVSEDVKSTCKKIAKILDIYLAGFDIITSDISKPLNETNGVINEINTTPGFDVIYKVANSETPVDIADIVLRDIFNL